MNNPQFIFEESRGTVDRPEVGVMREFSAPAALANGLAKAALKGPMGFSCTAEQIAEKAVALTEALIHRYDARGWIIVHRKEELSTEERAGVR